jgi:diacylglycerol kinase family enzyme
MRFVAVLNRDGGTLRTTDLDAFSKRIETALGDAGHEVAVRIVRGDEIVEALDKAARQRGVDVVMAGGGDGTISAAAAKLMGGKKALAVLPAGTMNLFARSIGVPLDLDGAVTAFAKAEVRPVDMALANGRPFIHQFSIGMHAKMVQLREKMDFGSRLGKMRASAKATFYTLKNPPSITARLRIGEAETKVKTTGIGVTNNLFGEGHLPYADHPDGGVLGIYVTAASERNELVRFFFQYGARPLARKPSCRHLSGHNHADQSAGARDAAEMRDRRRTGQARTGNRDRDQTQIPARAGTV